MSFENIQTKREHDPLDAYDDGKESEEPNAHDLDSFKNKERLNQLEDWLEQARIVQSSNRIEMAIDEDYYDNLQWDDSDKAELESRGQAPLVFNEIKPAINWILGTEKRTRIDGAILPRTEDDVKAAQTKTKLVKYLSDVNKTKFARSRAFADAVKAGLGWIEDGIRDDGESEPLFDRYENWRNVWYDHLGVERDLSDSRFLFRQKWLDLDIAEAMFPDRTAILEAASVGSNLVPTDDDEFFYESSLYYETDSQGRPISRTSTVDDINSLVNNRRSRVKLYEGWYRMPCPCKVVRLDYEDLGQDYDDINGQEYDKEHEFMKSAIDDGYASVYDAVKMKMFCAIFVKGSLLQNMESPYKHNRFPFTPVWAYRRARDNAPYGVIRPCRDPQDDLNKRRSKALFILSTNQVVMEKGAVEDKEQLREEAADPAGILEYKKGYKFDIRNDKALAEEHVMLSAQDGEYIRSVSGVTAENLGQETNASSGKAINARANQGSVVTAELFDNLRFATQLSGEIKLNLIEQFYTKRKVIRLTGDRGELDFVNVNSPDEPESDITKSQADYIVSEQDYRESIRVAMFEQLSDMVGKLAQTMPEVALKLLDLVVDMSDVEGKDEMVKRIREINGMSDPDAGNDPEKKAELEQKKKAEQEAAEKEQALQDEQVRLALDEQDAKTRKTNAETDKTKVETYGAAVDAAYQVAAVPEIGAVVDTLIDSATSEEGEM